MPLRHRLASIAIVACVGLQASTFVTGTWCWPFMVYGMYVNCHHPPVKTAEFTVIASFADGGQLEINQHNTLSTTGLGFFALVLDYIVPAMGEEPGAPERLADRIQARVGRPVETLAILKNEYELTDDGVVVRRIHKRLDPGKADDGR